mmetsp:Transcript_17484/g.26040  ORF Transcript_17484/g.26040 Transcript_17484/m.26040 type:complete len:381 (+) Transcript_17484:107-1249(+)
MSVSDISECTNPSYETETKALPVRRYCNICNDCDSGVRPDPFVSKYTSFIYLHLAHLDHVLRERVEEDEASLGTKDYVVLSMFESFFSAINLMARTQRDGASGPKGKHSGGFSYSKSAVDTVAFQELISSKLLAENGRLPPRIRSAMGREIRNGMGEIDYSDNSDALEGISRHKTISRKHVGSSSSLLTCEMARIGDLEGLRKELAALTDQKYVLSRRDENSRSPLDYACAGGHVEIIRELTMKFGVDANSCSEKDGYTALHHAAAGGKLQAVTFLVLVVSARDDVAGHDGRTPYDVASRNDVRKFFESRKKEANSTETVPSRTLSGISRALEECEFAARGDEVYELEQRGYSQYGTGDHKSMTSPNGDVFRQSGPAFHL